LKNASEERRGDTESSVSCLGVAAHRENRKPKKPLQNETRNEMTRSSGFIRRRI
jgi:hypothetical protein